jgi:hypothetical protein
MSWVRIAKLCLNTRRAKYVPIARYIGTSTLYAENPDFLRACETLLFSHFTEIKIYFIIFQFCV